jgi:hypothetical protein
MHFNRRNNQRWRDRRNRQQAAWQAALLNGVGTECPTCGDAFAPIRKTGRYCSNRCRQAAYRQRMRDNVDKLIAAMPDYTASFIKRARRKDEAQRRAKLPRAATRGDTEAEAELRKLAKEANR